MICWLKFTGKEAEFSVVLFFLIRTITDSNSEKIIISSAEPRSQVVTEGLNIFLHILGYRFYRKTIIFSFVIFIAEFGMTL